MTRDSNWAFWRTFEITEKRGPLNKKRERSKEEKWESRTRGLFVIPKGRIWPRWIRPAAERARRRPGGQEQTVFIFYPHCTLYLLKDTNTKVSGQNSNNLVDPLQFDQWAINQTKYKDYEDRYNSVISS